MLVYVTAIWHILRPFWYILWPYFFIFCGYLVCFMVIWYIFSCFGMFGQEKSGNPVSIHQIPQNLWRLARVVSVSTVGPEDRGLESPPALKY
jgi:hypothetical protein